jgi:Uncharacterized low-complexity proteins
MRNDLRYTNLRSSNLRSADLSGTDLTGSYIRRADLTGADLTNANLTGANLTCADLTGSDLTGANLSGAKLTGAKLTGARLPIWSKWSVTHSIEGTVVIGCQQKTIAQWDIIFEPDKDWPELKANLEEARMKHVEIAHADDETIRRVRACYMATRAYMIAMGIG